MYKKIRFVFRFTVVLLKKYYLLISVGLLLGALTFFLFPGLVSIFPQFHSTQKVAIIGRYTLTELPLSLQRQISVGLTYLDDSGLPQPALASGWQATDSGKTYIFTLDPAYRWQDGSRVVSSDIQYHFRDVKIDYPDPGHLIMHLPDAFAPLPTVVSQPLFKIVPRSNRYLGLGSYRIQSYHRNGQYLDSITLAPINKTTLPLIKYFFYPTASLARTAFKLGLVDSLVDIPETGDLASWPNITIQTAAFSDRYVAVFFNTADPILQGSIGKNLRLALDYAIDKSRWPHRAVSPINPSSWAFNSSVKTYDQDLVKAKQLLTKVDKLPDSINLTVVPAYLNVADQIKKDWEQLGLKVNLQVTQDVPDKFTALIIGQAIPTDPDQYNLWHSTQKTTNLTQLNNPRVDKLLEDGRKTSDIVARKQIYLDFQRYLLEEVPAVFLFYPQSYTVHRN